MTEHRHFDIEAAVSQVRKTFAQMRGLPNSGKSPQEIAVVELQRCADAEEIRVAFTRFYLGRVNEGRDNIIQANAAALVMADCLLDFLTGYDLSVSLTPANVVMTVLHNQLAQGITAVLNNDLGDVSNDILPTQSGSA